jgi:hypothetical protein
MIHSTEVKVFPESIKNHSMKYKRLAMVHALLFVNTTPHKLMSSHTTCTIHHLGVDIHHRL